MFRKIVLLIGIIVTAYIAFSALSAPETVLVESGLRIDGPNGRNEIRAQYGGFYGALTLALILSLLGRWSERFGLQLLLITVGGVLAGRVLSLVIEGPAIFASYSPTVKLFYAADIVIVVLVLLALRGKKT